MTNFFIFILLILCFFLMMSENFAFSREVKGKMSLDEKVEKFLKSHKDQWVDWNVSESDGRFLYHLIIKNRYTNALEIGTSTGRSAIWIAWALSKTGGQLTTIEIDEGRYRQALKNFQEAGLSDYIDARLADAHILVKELKGPYDFIFSDADKDWYKNYFMDLAPKLRIGGCFTAHNASATYDRGIRDYLDYVRRLKNFETTIARPSGAGISVSYKKFENE